MLIKKSDIEKIIKENKKLNELVGGDMFSNGGDKGPSNSSEIETGPVDKDFKDKSLYIKGVPTTTDKVVSRYRQDLPWFVSYNYGGISAGI